MVFRRVEDQPYLQSTPEKVHYDPERRILYLEVDSQFKRDYVLRKLSKLREYAGSVFGPVEIKVGELPLLEELERLEASSPEPTNILVIGLGSGGERMWAMDTDSQTLSAAKIPNKVLLGPRVTRGCGGSAPRSGRR
ncbi:MAG: hypothetical protein H5U03_06760 [Clostridia bacterium]|nr:hypothetical protein [Clostridia bacterium]